MILLLPPPPVPRCPTALVTMMLMMIAVAMELAVYALESVLNPRLLPPNVVECEDVGRHCHSSSL